MNFEEMKEIEPELQRLEEHARFAGANGADWLSVWMAMVEPLSKIVGHSGHREELRSDHSYSTARWALHLAWRRGAAEVGSVEVQAEMFSTSPIYR